MYLTLTTEVKGTWFLLASLQSRQGDRCENKEMTIYYDNYAKYLHETGEEQWIWGILGHLEFRIVTGGDI